MITRYKHLGIHKVTFEYQGGGVYITLNVTKMPHPTAEFRNVVGFFFFTRDSVLHLFTNPCLPKLYSNNMDYYGTMFFEIFSFYKLFVKLTFYKTKDILSNILDKTNGSTRINEWRFSDFTLRV